MKNKGFKAFSIFITLLFVTFGILFLLKEKQTQLILKNTDFDYPAYSYVDKQVFFDKVNEEESDYDHLEIFLSNDGNGENNIEDKVDSIYNQFPLELTDTNLIPVAEKIEIRYAAHKGTKISSQTIKKTLDFRPEVKLIDGNMEEVQDTYTLSPDQIDGPTLEFNLLLKKFDKYQESLELITSGQVKNEPGEYALNLKYKELDIDQDVLVIVEEDDSEKVADLSRLDVLVNKEYHLDETDIPPLKPIPINYAVDSSYEAQPEAVDAFINMVDTMKEETGMIVIVTSTYRSYELQVDLFNRYAASEGEEAANKYSARAGESEHQTGLALDVIKPGVHMDDFGTTEESLWVADNAHRFGFIVRFPEGKEAITGYQYEPWHLRYLGPDLAPKVKDSNLTFDEYWLKNLR